MEERLKAKNDEINVQIAKLLELSPEEGKKIIEEQGIVLEEEVLANEAPELDGRD